MTSNVRWLVPVLGTTYYVSLDVPYDEIPEGMDAYTNNATKEIKIANYEADFVEDETAKRKTELEYKRHLVRHEVIHAFLFESGINGLSHSVENWSEDEEIVDWIAIQFPKIQDSLNSLFESCLIK